MRWRLTQAHYLTVPGTNWEHREQPRTGKMVRKVYDVPAYLNPLDPGDHTHPELEAIIVCHEMPGQRKDPRDIVFIGNPTPDMEPLDDEAEELSEKTRASWVQPMSEEAMPGQGGGYGERMMNDFLKEMQKIVAGQQPSSMLPPTSTAGIDPAAFKKMQEEFAQLQKQHADLMAKLAGVDQPVVDDEEPLPPPPSPAEALNESVRRV